MTLVGYQNQYSFFLFEVWRRRVIYGTLACSIVHTLASPFPGLWLVAGLWVDITIYKYQLQLCSSTSSVLSVVFVCPLDTSWNHWASKCYYYCYYSRSLPPPPPPLCKGNSFWEGWVSSSLAGCVGVIWLIPGWFSPVSV